MILYLLVACCLLLLVLLLWKLRHAPAAQSEPLMRLSIRLEGLEQQMARLEQGLLQELRAQRGEQLGMQQGFQQQLSLQLQQAFESQAGQQQRMAQNLQEQMAGQIASLRQLLQQQQERQQESFAAGMQALNELQLEKFSRLEQRQQDLVSGTEKRLEQIRETVEEKLQKTLQDRIGQSFEVVGQQLERVQKGLGEMQSLAQDVGGLKKVLSNVKVRGTLGEVQLAMLLEQVLAPDQFSANVATRPGSPERVEFAIKMPGHEHEQGFIYLPIDAKFPKDVYEQLMAAYEGGDQAVIDAASRNMESVIRKMAKDICDKYLDPPHTTDFAILFLPFESIYAEVIRRSSLLEQLQRDCRVVVTGPTTLMAMLHSFRMGFRSLAIQKRSSEVWQVLGSVKSEFEKFGGMLEKARKNLHTAGTQLDEVMGRRTQAIQRKLRDVESLPAAAALPEAGPVLPGADEAAL